MPIFLFTDIEGSTEKWERYPEEMERALSRHDAILLGEINAHGGRIVSHTGDGVFAVFENGDPLTCAIGIQRRFSGETFGSFGELRLRVALHVGPAERRGDNYFGPAVNRVARIMAAGWGGQILVTPELLDACTLPAGAGTEDLGVHVFKDLAEPQHILRITHPDFSLNVFPPLRSLTAHPNNLPIQLTPFIGRKKILIEIHRTLEREDHRLLTLMGPGGIGKTRLALQGAAENIEMFPDGAYFIPLAPLRSVELIVPAVARALQFPFHGNEDPSRQLMRYLSGKKILGVFDNFEHLLDGAAIVSDILASAPHVKALVTTRERLSLRGESILEVEGLDVPEPSDAERAEDFASVQLFLESAARIQPGFSLTDEDRPHVIRICRLVEGMPLGIELASAWVRTLSCQEIAEQIEVGIDFLSTNLRDIPERHRSLKAAFEYSWRLLSEEEQDAFRRLSVFRGGFGLEAGKRIARVSLPVFSSLLDKSLLKRSAAGRYEIHELLRQFGREKLEETPGERERTLDRFCGYYAGFLEERAVQAKGRQQKKAFDSIAGELENVRSAWRWMTHNLRVDDMERAEGALFRFYYFRSHFHEAAQVFESSAAALRRGSKSPQSRRLLGKLLFDEAIHLRELSELEKSKVLLEESLRIAEEADDRREIALCVRALGGCALHLGNLEEANTLFRKSLYLFEELGDNLEAARCTVNIGNVIWNLGDVAEGKRLEEKALAIFRQEGVPAETEICLLNLGVGAFDLGDDDMALKCFQESLEIARELSDKHGAALSLLNLSEVEQRLGRSGRAKELLEEALAVMKELGERLGTANCYANLGEIAFNGGSYPEAERLHLDALALRKEIGDPVEIAKSYRQLGKIFLATGRWVEAESRYQEALILAARSNMVSLVTAIVIEMIPLLLRGGRMDAAFALLLFAAAREPEETQNEDRVRALLDEMERKLPRETVSSIKSKIRGKRVEELVESLEKRRIHRT